MNEPQLKKNQPTFNKCTYCGAEALYSFNLVLDYETPTNLSCHSCREIARQQQMIYLSREITKQQSKIIPDTIQVPKGAIIMQSIYSPIEI